MYFRSFFSANSCDIRIRITSAEWNSSSSNQVLECLRGHVSESINWKRENGSKCVQISSISLDLDPCITKEEDLSHLNNTILILPEIFECGDDENS